MRRPLLLAIDAGTGSCRAVLFDTDGRQVAASLREWAHAEPADTPGGQDFDVEGNWMAITRCVRDALGQAAATGADVVAVSSTSMREGIVLYDAKGKELWACPNVDSRAAVEARQMVEDGRAEQIYREAGDWVSITTPARLLWLAKHRPDLLAEVHGLSMLSDWILFRLSGARATERSCGSSSGMFTLSAGDWSTDITTLCGLPPDALPPVVDSGTVIGEVTEQAADQTGLAAGTPVVAGGADTQLGLLGAGIIPGEFTIVAGSFWQNTVLLDQPLIDPQTRLRTLCHVLPGEWMLEGIGFYCGMSMRWFRDGFCDHEISLAHDRGVDPYAVMEQAAAAILPGSNGVMAILSNLMNARRWIHASPSFLQFNVNNPHGSGRGACIRAIEEAAAYVARGHRDIIQDLTGASADHVVFTGGASKGALWPQIIADVLAVPVHVPAVKESSALGAALCAGTGVGLYSSPTQMRDTLRRWERTLEPSHTAVTSYDHHYAHWRQVYDRMLTLSEDGLLNPLWRAAGS